MTADEMFGGAISRSQSRRSAMRSRVGSGRRVSGAVSSRRSGSPDWAKIGASKAARAA